MSEPDPYRDRDLVELYDLDNPDGEDHDYYRSLATEIDAVAVVDLGCGTGLLTRSLAVGGRMVVGVDPSETMLDYARTRPGADRVRWIRGDVSALPSDTRADLVLCTGNAIMHVTADEFDDTLRAVAATLRPGGTLAFETRNPAAREWTGWTREATESERDTPFGRLREWIEVVDVDASRVVFDAHNVPPDGTDRVYRSVLYLRDPDVLRTSLAGAGFADVEIDGGWCGEDIASESRLLVVRATR